VNLKIKTLDEGNKDIATSICVTVVDTSNVKMVETRERSPRLPAMVFLENETDHLYDANAYLEDAEGSQIKLDLILGTQGWRRFVYKDVSSHINGTEGDKYKKMLGLNYLNPQEAPVVINRIKEQKRNLMKHKKVEGRRMVRREEAEEVQKMEEPEEKKKGKNVKNDEREEEEKPKIPMNPKREKKR